jgi:mycofactocin precursor
MTRGNEPTAARPAGADVEEAARPAEAGIAEELLIEEISIDGMCGVY